MNRRPGWCPFAILLRLIFPPPSKFIHGPCCEGRVLAWGCCRWHCRKLGLLLSALIISDLGWEADRIGRIGSIWPMCSRSPAASRIRIDALMRNSPETGGHRTKVLRVNGTFLHMGRRCTSWQFRLACLLIVV